MFGLPVGLLIKIGIGLAVAAALWFAVHAVENIGVERQKAEDAPIIAAAEQRATNAEGANKQLTASIDGVRAQCKAASAKFEEQHALDVKAQAAAKTALDALKARRAADQQAIATLDARVTAPSTGTPAQICAEAESTLSDLAKWRLQ